MNPDQQPSLSVTRYLRAEEQVVPFRGRPELDELLAWCGTGERLRIRLMTGDGGAGKTRLALRLCDELTVKGWQPLWMNQGKELNAAEAIRNLGPCVLVVDYAENRDSLCSMLCDIVADTSVPDVRVLLLARGTGEWWQRLISSSEERVAQLLSEPPIMLGPLQVEGGPSLMFDEALAVFASKLGLARPDVQLTLTDPEPLVLGVHAAALLAVLDHAYGSDITEARSAAEVLDGLLGHEARYWAQSATARGLDLDVSVQRLAVTIGCLIGANSETAATDLMRRIPDLADSAERRGKVARWLHDLYPEKLPIDDGPLEWLGPLRPDPVAERLILAQITRRPELIPSFFTDLTGDQAFHAMTMIARASLRELSDSGRDLIRTALAADLEHLAFPAFSATMTTNLVLGELLNEALCNQLISANALKPIADALPYPSIALNPLAATVLTMLTSQPADPDDRADLLQKLAPRLADLGQRNEALTAGEEAVVIRRRQAEVNPGLYLPKLALALNDQVNFLGGLGRFKDALKSVEEAIEIRRSLARDNPDVFLPDLAMSLNNQCLCLNELKRPEQALSAADESITIRRALVEDHPEVRSGLADSLNNRSISLGALQRQDDALEAVNEAACIYRTIALEYPDTHLPKFARVLVHLSVRLADAGQLGEALSAVGEAVGTFSALSIIRPSRYPPELANALYMKSHYLNGLGQRDEAMKAMAERAQILRFLAGGPTPTWLPPPNSPNT